MIPNENSMVVLDHVMVEPHIKTAQKGDRFQFMRQGYFSIDPVDTTADKLVFNQIVSLKMCIRDSVGCVHAMAHTLGGAYDTPHGVANAIMLPYVMEYNITACPERFADVAVAMGDVGDGLSVIEVADKSIAAVKRMSSDVGIPRLREVGCKKEDIPKLAELAFNDMNHNGNPKPMTVDKI